MSSENTGHSARKSLFVIIAAIAALITISWFFGLKPVMDTDACMDAGGMWNYAEKICEGL